MTTEDPLYQQPIANAFARPESAKHLGKVVQADKAYRIWEKSGKWSDRKEFVKRFYQAVEDEF